MKSVLFKLAFLYPRFYAFFCFYRKKRRRREFENKALLFSKTDQDPARVKRIVKGIFELRGVRKVMRHLIPLMDGRYIDRFVEVKDNHYLDRALQERRGIILMAGHIGIPHLAFNALRVMGYDVILLSGVTPKKARHPKFRYYDTTANTIFVHNPSLSEIYKRRITETLQSGGIIYYDGDAGEGRRKETLSFLGVQVDFPTGMIHLAHQSKARIIPFIHLYHRGKTRLIFKEPVDGNWKNGEGEYRRIVTEFAKILESYVLNYPEQYLGIYGPTVLSNYYRFVQDSSLMGEEEKRWERL